MSAECWQWVVRHAGFGEINLGGFTNYGTLAATGGTLSIRVDALTDLDGSLNTGVLEATSGSLHFVDNEGGVIPYRGHIRIGAGNELRLDQFGLRIDRGDSPSGLDFSGGSYVAPRLIQNGRMSVNSAAVCSSVRFTTRKTCS